jgi:hypothetical protein
VFLDVLTIVALIGVTMNSSTLKEAIAQIFSWFWNRLKYIYVLALFALILIITITLMRLNSGFTKLYTCCHCSDKDSRTLIVDSVEKVNIKFPDYEVIKDEKDISSSSDDTSN